MRTTPRALRTVLIGLGWVGTQRHLPALRRNAAFDLIGLIDSRPGRAAEIGRRTGVRYAAQATELAEVGWLGEAELCVVATEPARHAPLAFEALAAGKHVLTEKPFAMSVADGEQMLSAAGAAGRTLAVVHNFQFARSVIRLERDLAAGRLGRVQGLWGCQLGNPGRRLPRWYTQLPLGLFYDESPHLLYLLRRFGGKDLRLASADIGPVDSATATPANVYARFTASSEGASIPAVLSMFFETPLSEWYFAILGERAVGLVDIFRDVYVRLPNDGAHTAGTILGTSLHATLGHWSGTLGSGLRLLSGRLHYGNDVLYARLGAALQSAAAPADISGRDALDVLKLQHAILERRL